MILLATYETVSMLLSFEMDNDFVDLPMPFETEGIATNTIAASSIRILALSCQQ